MRKARHIPILTKEQIQRFLEAAKSHQMEELLMVALLTGIRQGELRALQWRHVDLESRTIQVCRTLHSLPPTQRDEEAACPWRRLIVLPQVAVSALHSQWEHQSLLRKQSGEEWSDHDLVFADPWGRPFSAKSLLHTFYQILDEAKLPPLHFHDLRRNTLAILLSLGVSQPVVGAILGHKVIAMTTTLYAHITPFMLDDGMRKWDDFLG